MQRAAPAVVSVSIRGPERSRSVDPFFDDPFFRYFLERFGAPGQGSAEPDAPSAGSGSGVVVRPYGLIVTNYHVVDGADAITVSLADRRRFDAELVAVDRAADLALLRIDADGGDLATLPFGDSDAAVVGDLVLAIGNPFGIGQTVTSGILSAKGRTHPELRQDVTFLQTDAAINPGNSGGALIGLDGALLGVNTAIFTRGGGSIGIGFAVPSAYVRAFVERTESGAIDQGRPWLGVRAQAVDTRLARDFGLDRPRGVVLTEIYPGAAAAVAGLMRGDVVLAVDGVAVDGDPALRFRLALAGVGATVTFRVIRRGAEIEREVVLTPPPAEPAADLFRFERLSPLFGLSVANLSPAFAERLSIDMFARGVVVVEADPRSRAALYGFRPRDIVETVNGEPVASVRQLRALLEDGRRWRVAVRRDGRLLTVLLRG